MASQPLLLERFAHTEQDLRDFVEHAPVALHVVGRDGTILWANRAELELLGYAHDEYVAHHIADFHADGPAIQDILARFGRGETLRQYPARLRCRDGSIKDVVISSSAHFEYGRLVHTRCCTLDVTDRKHFEASLRESEHRYHRLTELLPVAVYACEAPTGVIAYYNREAVQLWGRAPKSGDTDERFCGSLKLFLPDGTFLPHDECPMAVALRDGRAFRNQEVVIERPDGTRVTALVNIDPIFAGGSVAGAVNVFHDISALKRAEQALRATEERYRAVVESQAEMICRFRCDGTILFVNSAYARALGTTPEELMGRGFWAYIAEEDRPLVKAMLDGLTREAPEARIENRFDTADGERWTLWTNRAIAFDSEGRLLEAQSTGIDITDRKKAAEALREADRRKDEFLAVLGHELRNPLAPLRTGVELLQRDGANAKLVENVGEMMQRQLSHLVRLVDDLLDISRISRGTVELKRAPLDVQTVIDAAVELAKPLIADRGHRLAEERGADPLPVDGDFERLTQVIGNLLSNAAKYTDPGGEIRICTGADDGHAVVRVSDTGYGIPPERLQTLFEMFTRVPEHVALTGGGGLGIGLALSRELVAYHGGAIEARSEGLGRGSEFIVRLPLARRHGAASSQ